MKEICIQLFAEGEAATAQTEAETTQSEATQTTEPAPSEHEETEVSDSSVLQNEQSIDNTDAQDTQVLYDFDRDRLERDMRELQRFYPSFSPEDEMCDNPSFSRLLRAGATVRQAYEVSHLPEILHAAMSYAARKTAEKTASSAVTPIPVRENARSAVTPVQTTTGKHSGWTEREILAILNGKSKL